jgi:hypothetical protein
MLFVQLRIVRIGAHNFKILSGELTGMVTGHLPPPLEHLARILALAGSSRALSGA